MRSSNKISEKLKAFALKVMDDLAETDFFGVCYQTAFYILLTFFPLMIFLINFAGKIISGFETTMYDFLHNFMPDLVFNSVKGIIENLKMNVRGDNYLILIVAFIFSGLAIYTIIKGLSRNSRNTKPLVDKRLWLLIIIITFLFVLSLIFVLAEYLVLDVLVVRIFNILGLSQWIITITKVFSSLFAGVAMVIGFVILYTLTSPQQMRLKHNVPGAFVTVVILVVFFRIYLYIANNSIRYTLFYGRLGGFFLFMVVIYFSTVIINIGCKFNLYLYCYRYQNGLLFPV